MRLIFVDPLGLEPRMTIPKTVVLPLHHGSIGLQIYNKIYSCETDMTNLFAIDRLLEDADLYNPSQVRSQLQRHHRFLYHNI